MKSLEFSGERVVPGQTPLELISEHEQRYNFAAQFVKGQVVLDIACGSGMGSEFLLRSGAKKVTGVDIDAEAVAFASQQYPKVDFMRGDASSHIPLPDASVDVVVSFETIEHFPNHERFLEECRRVLKPGGKFICSSPNLDVSRWGEPNPFHVKELRPKEFVGIMERFFSPATDSRTAGTFAQREILYPKWVARALARKVVEKIGIKPILKRLLNIQPGPTATNDHFVERLHGMTPYRHKRLYRPVFLIYVGQKS